METLILTGDDVRHIVVRVGLDELMDELIRRLTDAFRAFRPEDTVIPARQGFVYDRPHAGLLEWMPCMRLGERAAIKIVGYHPANPRGRNLPTILSTISAYDTATGHLICMMDGTLLTALRTGAASAVASRLMASPRTATVGLIGAGTQAVTQLHALTRVLPVERVLVYDQNPAVQHSFAERVACFAGELPVECAPPERLIGSADVICTATSVEIGAGPVFDGIEPKPWAHFNAVGSDFPGKIEIPLALLRRGFVSPDFREQAVHEGECQQLAPEEIGPSLYELVQQPDRYRFAQESLSVFDSTGWALEDQVAMDLFMRYAVDLGVGRALPVELVQEDAVNPYHFAAAQASRLRRA